MKSQRVMEVTGLLIFLLLGLSTHALDVLKGLYFVNQLKNWTEAQSYCRETFADLATIESADDWTRVKAIVANSGQPKAWIGLYDDEKSWRWSLDNTSLYEQDYGSWFVLNRRLIIRGQSCAYLSGGNKLLDYYCEGPTSSVCYDATSNSYIQVAGAKSWYSAQSYCRQTYTDLASIRNQQEWDDILSLVDPNADYWMGLSGDGWKWSDQSNSSYVLSVPGDPRGANDSCGRATSSSLCSDDCSSKLPFICSGPPQHSKVLKVTLKTDGSVNLNDPLVQEAVLKQMEKDLRGHGVNQELRWRKQPHGDVFNKTEQ